MSKSVKDYIYGIQKKKLHRKKKKRSSCVRYFVAIEPNIQTRIRIKNIEITVNVKD